MDYNVTLKQLLYLVIVTLSGVICSVTFSFPLVIGFLPGFISLVLFAIKHEIASKQIIQICLRGLNKTRIVIFILFLVSFLLPSWYLSGTIQQMVKLALHVIVPSHFLTLSFIIAMIFSMILGTSVGTLSSIGIPILGSAIVLHLPVNIVAGALISGAFVGDRTSPFSSSHQLLSHTIEVPVKKQFKAMLITSILGIFLSLIFYGVADYHTGRVFIHTVSIDWGQISLVTFIPPLILILLVFFRYSIVYAFLASILSAVLIAFFRGTSILKVSEAFWHGVNGYGGGLAHMYSLLLFLALAGAYNGLLEELNIIQPYLDQWLKSSKSILGDTVKMMVATLLISLISANQTLPIIMTGRSFLPYWSRKYGNRELARIMGDSTMIFPAIIPWSVLAMMCSTILGIPLLNYLPYAYFLFLLPLLTLLVSIYKQLFKVKGDVNELVCKNI